MGYDQIAEQMNSLNQAARQYVGSGGIAQGSTLGSIKVEPKLNVILERLRNEIRRVRDTAGQLNNHADLVFGPIPEGDEKGVGCADRGGIIGEIEDALDALSAANTDLAHAAGRNCNLA